MLTNMSYRIITGTIPLNYDINNQLQYDPNSDSNKRLEYGIKNHEKLKQTKDPLLFEINRPNHLTNPKQMILKVYKDLPSQIEDQNKIDAEEKKNGYPFFDKQEDRDELRECLLRDKPDVYMKFNTYRKVARYLAGFVSNGHCLKYQCLKCPQCDRIPARKDVIEQLVSRVFPLGVFDHTILPGCVIGVIVDYL